MLHFHVSKALAKPLSRCLKPARNLEADFFWRADVALIGMETCVVMQEQFTQYLMVFCGLQKAEFEQFPGLFRRRFTSEMSAICKQAMAFDERTLKQQLVRLCDEQHYQLDPEPLEEGRIPKVIEKLERRFLYEREPLPKEGRAAFEFTFQINSRLPKFARDEQAQSAAEAIGDLCLNLIDRNLAQLKPEQPAPAVVSTSENIVHVDFGRNRNQ